MNIQIQKDHTNLQPLMFPISSSLQDKTTFLSINLHTLTNHNNKTTDTYLTCSAYSVADHAHQALCCKVSSASPAASMNWKKLHFVQHKKTLLLLKHDE